MNQAFPGTEDERTVEQVDAYIKACNGKLPTLPVPQTLGFFTNPVNDLRPIDGFTADQMQSYARLAVSAALASAENASRSGDLSDSRPPHERMPSGWKYCDEHGDDRDGWSPASAEGGHGVQVPQGWRETLIAALDEVGEPAAYKHAIVDAFARRLLAAAPEAPARCWCRTCRPITMDDMRFVVCPDCGNKRCPKANDHRNACTNSNEPGQPGSAYPAPEAPAQAAQPGQVDAKQGGDK